MNIDFDNNIKNFSARMIALKKTIKTEEATKTSLILPFFQLLGYDIFNPHEFVPEYTADVGIKKGEKVDYAIILNNEVSILIEAKPLSENLDKHSSQLFRYFGTTRAKFAILTNGINYKFYTDLEKENIMDLVPFLDINMEELTDHDIQQLKKFQKQIFDVNNILSTASNLKYMSLIKQAIREESQQPSEEFIKLLLNKGVYNGVKTASVIEKFSPIVKKSFNSYVNDIVKSRLQNAIDDDSVDTKENDIVEDEKNEIITTAEELQAYYIVKSIVSEVCDLNSINYKDTFSYFGVLYKNNVRKWICRIYLKDSVRYIIIPDSNNKEKRYDIHKVDDIYKLKKEIRNRLKSFLEPISQ